MLILKNPRYVIRSTFHLFHAPSLWKFLDVGRERRTKIKKQEAQKESGGSFGESFIRFDSIRT